MDRIGEILSEDEVKLIGSLDTPEKVQAYIDAHITYDPYREDRTIKDVVKDKYAECYNSALFASCCLLTLGFETSVIELLARNDEEHILCVYKKNGLWGSLAQSKFAGLKGRLPRYKTIHDLVVSYMELYFAFDGHYSLESYTDPIELDKYSLKWLTEKECVITIAKDLRDMRHHVLTDFSNGYFYVSPERYWRETLFIPKDVVIPDEYLSEKPDYLDLGKLREK